MGQYWVPVNLDKREYIHPHRLGTGLKLWEQLANHPGTAGALIILTAAMPEPRGGGDFDLEKNWHGPERNEAMESGSIDGCSPGPMPEEYPAIAARTIGRWAGDRIAIIGDYAEDDDLGPEYNAAVIYALCHDPGDIEETAEHWEKCNWTDTPELKAKWAERARLLREQGPFADITDDVCAVIEHELGGNFDDSRGFRVFVPGETDTEIG